MLLKNVLIKVCEKCNEQYICRKDKKDVSRFCSRICLGSFISADYQKKMHDQWANETYEETKSIMRESFERWFEKTEGCWEWKGHKKKKLPYGAFTFRRKELIASRVSYTIYKGVIPQGLIVRHTCDNPSCVNPDHLLVGTYLDNHKDKLARGRGFVEKLTVEQVIEIKKALLKKIPDSHIAPQFGVTASTIGRIKNGRLWSWVII